jgi:hypothetical protein
MSKSVMPKGEEHSLLIACACGKQLAVPPQCLGQRFRCRTCQRVLVATATPGGALAPTSQQPEAVEPRRRLGKWAVAAAGLVAVLLLLLLGWFLPTSPEDKVAGSWKIDANAARESHPLLASARDGITFDFRRDGTFLFQLAGQPTSGEWRVVPRDGNTTLELSTPDDPSQKIQATLSPDGRLTANLPGALGTVPFMPAGPNGSPWQSPSGGPMGQGNWGQGSGLGALAPGGAHGNGMGPSQMASAHVPYVPPPFRALIDTHHGAGQDTSTASGGANYSQIEGNLWMGGAVPSPPPGTKATMNLNQADDPYRTDVYLWVPIPDAPPAPSLGWLNQQVQFVDAQVGGKVTYVHCAAGKSRSGLVVVGYEMFKHHWPRDQALNFVRMKRPQVSPNPAFMQLLLQWQAHLGLGGGGGGGGSGGGGGP